MAKWRTRGQVVCNSAEVSTTIAATSSQPPRAKAAQATHGGDPENGESPGLAKLCPRQRWSLTPVSRRASIRPRRLHTWRAHDPRDFWCRSGQRRARPGKVEVHFPAGCVPWPAPRRYQPWSGPWQPWTWPCPTARRRPSPARAMAPARSRTMGSRAKLAFSPQRAQRPQRRTGKKGWGVLSGPFLLPTSVFSVLSVVKKLARRRDFVADIAASAGASLVLTIDRLDHNGAGVADVQTDAGYSGCIWPALCPASRCAREWLMCRPTRAGKARTRGPTLKR